MNKLLAITPLMLLVAACAGSSPTAPPTTAPTPSPAESPTRPPAEPTAQPTASASPTPGSPAPTPTGEAVTCLDGQSEGDASVRVVDFGFDPAVISVSVGQTVIWTNTGELPHTVTFNQEPKCGTISPGESVAAEFGAPGDYGYHCSIHPTMRGTVSVSP